MLAADNIHKYFFIFFFLEKIRLDISCEFSAWQRIHMKHQAAFSSKDKSKKKLKCRLLQFVCGAFRVKGKLIPDSDADKAKCWSSKFCFIWDCL